MMEFETVERCGRVHVVKNGVESVCFAQPAPNGRWATTMPQVEFTTSTRAIALDLIAEGMDTWYTATEAANRLVEMGVFNVAPSAHDVCMWARYDKLPGAIKITGKGGWGQGGSWRIPASALLTFAEGRKGQ